MMQNGLGESFWDAHGVEIGACTDFMFFLQLAKTLLVSNLYDNRMLWVVDFADPINRTPDPENGI